MTAASKPVEFPLEPALEFLQHLWLVNHALERRSLQMERTLGVTAQQRVLVRCIGKYPGLTGSKVASVLHLDRGTVSVALRRLEKKGLITMRRDPRDSRRVALGLTTKGRAVDQSELDGIEPLVEELLAEVGAANVETAKAVLLRLAQNLAEGVPNRPQT